MGFFIWRERGSAARDRVLLLLEHGTQRANAHDLAGAIDDYTTIIGMRPAPDDLKALALLNRGLAYGVAKNYEQAAHDLHAVLTMPAASPVVRAAAKEQLGKMRQRSTASSSAATVAVAIER